MGSNYLIKFLEEKEAPTITKKRHTYLTYYGLEQQDTEYSMVAEPPNP